jgi:MOSC domain-containing protein YiiM
VKLVSVNVGRPRTIEAGGRKVRTAIFKAPAAGRVAVGRLNLEGDTQSDLRVHGGPNKAVYLYPAGHYDAWRAELPEMDFPYGAFGENLTVDGLDEASVRVGDRLRVGTAEMVVTQPRMPCFKLGIRFGRADMVKRFYASRRFGFYLAVEREGELGAGDAVVALGGRPGAPSIADLVAAYVQRRGDPLE